MARLSEPRTSIRDSEGVQSPALLTSQGAQDSPGLKLSAKGPIQAWRPVRLSGSQSTGLLHSSSCPRAQAPSWLKNISPAILQGLALLILLEASSVSGTSLSLLRLFPQHVCENYHGERRGPPAGSWEFLALGRRFSRRGIWTFFFLRRKKSQSLSSGFRDVAALKMFQRNMNKTFLQCNLDGKKCVVKDRVKPVSLANLEQPAKFLSLRGSLEYSVP